MARPAEVSWHGTLWGVDLAGFQEVESVPALDAVNRHEEDPCSHNLGRADNLPDDIRQASCLVLQVLQTLQKILRGLPPLQSWTAIPSLRVEPAYTNFVQRGPGVVGVLGEHGQEGMSHRNAAGI